MPAALGTVGMQFVLWALNTEAELLVALTAFFRERLHLGQGLGSGVVELDMVGHCPT